jgi:hypothetical protein
MGLPKRSSKVYMFNSFSVSKAEGGVLLAAKPGVSWQVKVLYKEEVFRSASEAGAEGKEVKWRFRLRC